MPLREQAKAINPRGAGGQRPPGLRDEAVVEFGARGRLRELSCKRFAEGRVSRFPPIDHGGNGNGKRSLFAHYLGDERPVVPVRQKCVTLSFHSIFTGTFEKEVFDGNDLPVLQVLKSGFQPAHTRGTGYAKENSHSLK